MKYNKQRYLELLNIIDSLSSQNEIVPDELYSERNFYGGQLESQIYWETQDQYLDLFTEF